MCQVFWRVGEWMKNCDPAFVYTFTQAKELLSKGDNHFQKRAEENFLGFQKGYGTK